MSLLRQRLLLLFFLWCCIRNWMINSMRNLAVSFCFTELLVVLLAFIRANGFGVMVLLYMDQRRGKIINFTLILRTAADDRLPSGFKHESIVGTVLFVYKFSCFDDEFENATRFSYYQQVWRQSCPVTGCFMFQGVDALLHHIIIEDKWLSWIRYISVQELLC